MRKNMYFTLFMETFKISALTFGGGYVIVPLLKEKFVDNLELIDDDEMYNMIAISNSSPGALAVNVSIILGYKIRGILGAIVCAFATVLPPLIIITIISKFYDIFASNIYVTHALYGMRVAVSASIAIAVINMFKSIKHSKLNVIIFAISLILSFYFSSITLILATIFIGVIYSIIKKEKI